MSNSAGGQMRTDKSGHVAISWTQTEVDGLEEAPIDQLGVGSTWSWRGRSLKLSTELVENVDRSLASGIVAELADWCQTAVDEMLPEHARIELSNGAQKFVAKLAMVVGEEAPVLVFEGGCPEPGQEFWVSAAAAQIEPVSITRTEDRTVVAFPGPARVIRDEIPDVAVFAAE